MVNNKDKKQGINDNSTENEQVTPESQGTENQSESQQQSDNIEQNDAEAVVSKLQEELKDSKEKYLRLFAEFDNYKKREAKEKREWIKTAGQDIVRDLLPVLDDIQRANKTLDADKNIETYAGGAKLIFDKLQKTLQQKGLKSIESIGKPFDVEYHEAIAEIPVADSNQKGKIVDEVEAGYTLNDAIIRYAKVVVGK
ncbi:MAG TPA: nucleotide exchange factor GrpE [Chitinophagales bacterium]|nr:nucleotide exchange factor GrpE [Chitinophagales bacterium]